MKQYFSWLLFMVILVVGIMWWQWPDDQLRVTACDVGQGDAFLIQQKFNQILVDGGPGEGVLDCLGENVPFWDRHLELLVVTHPQRDHMEGAIAVLERYGVGAVLTTNVWVEGQLFEAFREAVVEAEVPVRAVKQGDRFTLGQLVGEVLWPEDTFGEELVWDTAGEIVAGKVLGAETQQLRFPDDVNEASVVFLLRFGNFEALFTGDIGVAEELVLVNRGLIPDVELVKVAHHGSRFSSVAEFVASSKAEWVMIGVGENSYGHPTKEVVERWRDSGAAVLRTDVEGTVSVVSDGEFVWRE